MSFLKQIYGYYMQNDKTNTLPNKKKKEKLFIINWKDLSPQFMNLCAVQNIPPSQKYAIKIFYSTLRIMFLMLLSH